MPIGLITSDSRSAGLSPALQATARLPQGSFGRAAWVMNCRQPQTCASARSAERRAAQQPSFTARALQAWFSASQHARQQLT